MSDPMADRLARMLGLVPYLSRSGRPVPIREVAAHFGVSEQQIRRDIKALWLVGTPGMQYDDMLQFGNYDDHDAYVDLRDARGLTRPLRLSYPEAVALIAALRALAPLVAGRAELANPVASTLDKLLTLTHAQAVDSRPDRAAEADDIVREADIVDVRLPRPGEQDVAEAVTAALVGERQLAIDYVDAADHVSRRTVDPGRLHLEGGSAYLLAWCHRAQAPRTFRMDRILTAEVLNEPAEHQMDDDGEMSVAEHAAAEHGREIELVLASAGRWLSEELPTLANSIAPDGTTTLRLRVASPDWLRRLLLAQARHVVAVPPDIAADVAAAAEAALANYPNFGVP